VTQPPSERFEVLFVGAVRLLKGVPYLLDAFTRLRHPHKRLTIVGTMADDMRTYLRLHPPPESVVFRGHVPQGELKEIMSSSHVLVLPSITDGFGLVMAQAMACGCPVIASENTGARELFTDGEEGFVVPIRDPGLIHDRLQLMMEEPELRRVMGERALKRVRQMGGWNNHGNCMERVLDELVYSN